MKQCEHLYGVDNEWGAAYGATHIFGPPSESVLRSPYYEPFKFCPECGEQLIKEPE